MKVSFLRISASRESTQRFIATLPCLIPIPYGSARKRSFVSFRLRSAAAMPSEPRVVPHQRVRPPLVEGEQRVRQAVVTRSASCS